MPWVLAFRRASRQIPSVKLYRSARRAIATCVVIETICKRHFFTILFLRRSSVTSPAMTLVDRWSMHLLPVLPRYSSFPSRGYLVCSCSHHGLGDRFSSSSGSVIVNVPLSEIHHRLRVSKDLINQEILAPKRWDRGLTEHSRMITKSVRKSRSARKGIPGSALWPKERCLRTRAMACITDYCTPPTCPPGIHGDAAGVSRRRQRLHVLGSRRLQSRIRVRSRVSTPPSESHFPGYSRSTPWSLDGP